MSFRRIPGAAPRAMAAIFVIAATACTSSNEGVICPRPEPAFRVELTAAGGSMPEDTTVEVIYQGSETETYSLHGSRQNQDVCCRFGARASGALPHVSCERNPPPPVLEAGLAKDAADSSDGGRVTTDASVVLDAAGTKAPSVRDAAAPDAQARMALFCELSTNGPATIHVTASGYAAIDQDLHSKVRDDGCGLRTVDVELMLGRPDGGTP